MRAPTPPSRSAEAAAALEAAVTFLRSCIAINWFGVSNSAGISFFLPEHGRAKLGAMYKKTFTKLFAMARDGDAEADFYLRQELLEEARLPPAKRKALEWLLLHPITKRRRGRAGRKGVTNLDRDFIIAQAVRHATLATGLLPTRSKGTATASGSSVVVKALKRLGLPQMTESTVNRIWVAHTSREDEEAAREGEEEMKTLVVLPKAGTVINN
jgi:hypothetical protein